MGTEPVCASVFAAVSAMRAPALGLRPLFRRVSTNKINNGGDQTRYTLLFLSLLATAASAEPPFTQPIDTNVVNTPTVEVVNTPEVFVGNSDMNPVPVTESESAGDWYAASGRSGTDCSQQQGGCSFVSVGIDLTNPDFGDPIPAGKALLLQTITVTYGGGISPVDFSPGTAAFQILSPFQRYVVGEVLPTPGFTSGAGMATANLNVLVTRILSAVVGFTDPNDRPNVAIQTNVYVSGRLIDAE